MSEENKYQMSHFKVKVFNQLVVLGELTTDEV